MAPDSTDPAQRPPDFRVSIEQSLAGVIDSGVMLKGWDWLVSLALKIIEKTAEWVLRVGAKMGGTLALGLARGEDRAQDAFGELARVAIKDMFGVDAAPRSLNDRGNRSARTQTANDIGDMLLRAFAGQVGTGGAGEIEPSDAPAKAFLSAMAQLALEGWLEGWIVEACSLGQLETFGELDDAISHVLGLGRASAAVHGPLVRRMIVEPLDQKISLAHRPNLLGAGEAVRQVLRGRKDAAWLDRELGRQGWSADRIEALVNAQRKFLGVGDVNQLVTRGFWNGDQARAYLGEQGYDETAADLAMRVEGTKRIEQHEGSLASAILSAYASRDIDGPTFRGLIDASLTPPAERALVASVGELRRALNVKRMTAAQVEAAVKAKILAVPDYRAALRRDGYDEADVLVLELQLRYEMDRERSIEEHRAAADAERAAEKEARAAAAATRRAEIEQERALRRRGPLADLERAAVRGLIPIVRVEEVLRAQYDADTVSIIVDLIEGDRQTYLTEQQRRADALKRAEFRSVDVGALEQAVLNDVLTVEQFRTRLSFLQFRDDDAAILTATLAARKADLDDARAKRRAAEIAAGKRSIDLGRFEQLVRRGARTLAEYDALLASLGFDEPARVAMADLLRLHIADDERARQARTDAEAALNARGVSIEQFRRAVILGVKSSDDYQRFLVDQKFTADAQIVLMAELADDVAEADAARARRKTAAAAAVEARVHVSTIARAARLGLVTPAVYQQALARAGYSADDIEIELQLLLTEIADVQAARARRDALAAAAVDRGLSLQQLERAVKAGVTSIDAYRARAIELGYAADDVAILVAVLGDELALRDEARARKAAIGAESPARALSLDELDAAAKAGLLTIDAYVAAVVALGYSTDDAQLLAALVLDELVAAEGVAA